MTKQAMGQHVDQLEALGYLERVADPRDRRAKLVRPSRRGREVKRVVRVAMQHMEHELAVALGTRGAARVRSALQSFTEPDGE
jgi:DNA-binding MarR family transcriptional regulator